MGKASSSAMKPQDVLEAARQQNYMSNPNQHNYFGSTETTFDANDQATINQTMSPELQGLLDTQMDFVRQGPAQLGDYSNPMIADLLGGTMQGMAARGGYQMPSSDQGGYQSQMPQADLSFGIIPEAPAVQPEAPILQGGGTGGGINPNGHGDFKDPKLLQAAQAMQNPENAFSNLGMQLGHLLQKKPENRGQ